MARIWINDQLGVWDVLGWREGVDGRDHDVVVAVHDKGRLFDGLEFRKRFATRLTPLGDSHPLCCHCLRRCGRVHIILSHMPSRPEGPCGGLARSGRAEEQIKKRLDRDFTGLRIGQGGVIAAFRLLPRRTRATAPPMEKPSRSTCASPSAPMKSAAWSAIASIVSGVSPVDAATPALSNRMTGRCSAKPSVSAESQ